MLSSKKQIISIFLLALLFFRAAFAHADLNLIANAANKETLSEKQVRDLYLGVLRSRKIELVEQSSGQSARSEFYSQFLQKDETQIKRQWSILIFSGERVPVVVSDDKAVFEYVKSHPNAIGYVSTVFWEKEKLAKAENQPIELFTVKGIKK